MNAVSSASRPGQRTHWHLPLALCLTAFVVRAGIYFLSPGIVHPDETFQYIEQGHRLLGHSALVPWEFHEKIRNWVLPGLVAALLWLAGLIDLDPVGRVQAVSLAFAAWSVLSIWAAYRWAGRSGGPAAAVAAAGLNIASIEMAHIGAHPLSETLATPLLVWGLYLAETAGPGRARGLAAGALLGACVFLRIQLAPAAALGIVFMAWRQPGAPAGRLVLAAAAMFLAGGMLDWATLGTPFQSVWRYVHLNIGHGVAAQFGVEPWYRYLAWLRDTWGPLFVPMIVLAAVGTWRAPVPAAYAAAIALPLFAIGHKEPRFLYPALPFAMVLVALGAVRVAQAVGCRWPRAVMPPHALGAAIAAAFLVAAVPLGAFSPGRPRWPAGVATGAAMRLVNADPDACGVALTPPQAWGVAAGYAYLRGGIRLYVVDPAGADGQFAAFNYIFSRAGELSGPPGYTRVTCWEEPHRPHPACLWRRAGACLADDGQTGAVPLVLPVGIPGRDAGR